MSSIPVINAELFLECQNTLGEGILWDSKTNLLHWVDINESQIHTLDPETKEYSIDHYPESQYLTAIALRKTEPGFIGTISHAIVFFPEASKPTSTSTSPPIRTRQTLKTLSTPLPSNAQLEQITRFNDGAADAAGRFFAGSMTLPELKDGKKRGELWRYDPDGTQTRVLDSVGTSNGIGWSPDNKLMYYIDSIEDEILVFDYNLSLGTLTNRRSFAKTPQPLPGTKETIGVFDGLTIDAEGNIWAARWKDQRVVGFKPNGEIIGYIRVPGCKSPTIPCFGGKNLDVMFITSAHSRFAGEGDIQLSFPHSGDLFSVDLSLGSEARRALGLGDSWKGKERHRFAI